MITPRIFMIPDLISLNDIHIEYKNFMIMPIFYQYRIYTTYILAILSHDGYGSILPSIPLLSIIGRLIDMAVVLSLYD